MRSFSIIALLFLTVFTFSCNRDADENDPYTNPVQYNYISSSQTRTIYKLPFGTANPDNWTNVGGTVTYQTDGILLTSGGTIEKTIANFEYNNNWQIELTFDRNSTGGSDLIALQINRDNTGDNYLEAVVNHNNSTIKLLKIEAGTTTELISMDISTTIDLKKKTITVRQVNNDLYLFMNERYIGKSTTTFAASGRDLVRIVTSNGDFIVKKFIMDHVVVN